MKVGAVSYLNTKPLVYNLPASGDGINLVFDLPSRLADRLAAGELDVALIPSIEFFQTPQLYASSPTPASAVEGRSSA
jgi:chorismate dehydratase